MDAQAICPPVESVAESARILVSVHDVGGAHYAGDATVLLRKPGVKIRLERGAGQILYEGHVPPGPYTLTVTTSSGNLVAPRRQVQIPPEGTTASAYLGGKDWPTYRLGENIIPFEIHDDVLAVVFETRVVPPERVMAVATRAARQARIGLYRYLAPDNDPRGSHTGQPFMSANDAIWLFQLRNRDADHREWVAEQLRAFFAQEGYPVRIGMPVDVRRGQVKVIDNRFVVRFRPAVRNIDQIACRAGARVRRGFIQAPNARLLEIDRGGLDIIERWRRRKLLVYGEPDLAAQITSSSLPGGDPVDTKYREQTVLPLQHIDTAWQFLRTLDADHHRTFGSPDVYVATVDAGIEPRHPDVGGNLTDGTSQLAVYHDFADMVDCLACGADCVSYSTHGMQVFSIIAARTDNTIIQTAPGELPAGNIAGIAPNAHQIAIKFLGVSSVTYQDILLWTAGFQPLTDEALCGKDALPENWPEAPIIHRADIINCSHYSANLPRSGLMDDTLTYLATNGRDKRGTVMIYAAGNTRACMTGTSPWASHPCTIAVSYTTNPCLGTNTVEKIGQFSNYGPEIDLCACGEGVWTLLGRTGEATFGDTSAAAPTIAAAAALILSVNPSLTWDQVRQVLCDTAEKVDPDLSEGIGAWSTEPRPFSQYYGYGRLRVLEAVQRACELAGPRICRPDASMTPF